MRLTCRAASAATAAATVVLAFGFVSPAQTRERQVPPPLWVDVTARAIGATKHWTNKVEIADLNGDGRPDLLFANGGNYSTPGAPEPNQVFFNGGPGVALRGSHRTQVFGATPDLARVIKARDLNGDGLTDIVVGTTYQTQSRLYLGTGQGRSRKSRARTCRNCRSASATSKPATWMATAISTSCWPTGVPATT